MNKGVYFIGMMSLFLASCGAEKKTEQEAVKQDTIVPKTDTVKVVAEQPAVDCANDSLDELAKMIAGVDYAASAKVLKDIFETKSFKEHAANFEKKWTQFDTTRLQKLVGFRTKEIFPNVGETKTLFYPFSGPDILYGYTFFPDAEKYILMGLEPVGTRAIYDEAKEERDSLNKYYKKINTSLHAILKFSFF